MFRDDVSLRRLQKLDRHAARIEDPIARLQFLRAAAAGIRCRSRWRRTASQIGAVVMLMGMAGLAGLHSRQSPATLAIPLAPGAAMPASFHPLASAAPQVREKSSTVWLVESGRGFESYSNGLRVDTSREQAGVPRSYRPISIQDWSPAEIQTNIVGIVFHSSESELAPFEPEATTQLKRRRAGLLDYASSIRAYHYVIDRFGAVHRLVSDASRANHAGNSIWADESRIYLQLNSSFLGVAFESESRPSGGIDRLTEAQIRGGRALIEMLRSRYGISSRNCVTHAQVSVNPANSRVGYHTDWASAFPFAELGLPGNYSIPLASVSWFGFDWDPYYWEVASQELRTGADSARRLFTARALSRGISVDALRRRLQLEYRTLTATGVGDQKSD